MHRKHYIRSLGVQFGNDCRFGNEISWGSEPYLITLGDHVTITNRVSFVTHDGGVWVARDRYPQLNIFGQITVGSNTFIGINAILMPGITVGDNCVIGAGSVVTRDIQDGSVAVGAPAKVIRTTEEYISRMLVHPGRVDTKGLSGKSQREILLSRITSDDAR